MIGIVSLVRTVALSTLLASTLAAEARADELQDRVLAAARATRPDAYAFRRTRVMEATGQGRKILVEQYDPRRPMPERWSLISIDGRPPTAKQLAGARKRKRESTPSYADIAKWIGGPATRVPAPPGYTAYRFARLPRGAIKLGPRDASADIAAEALVNVRGATPFVERVRLTSTKGFRMMLVASVKSMTVTGRYRPGPDGRPVPADTASDMTGSLMGKSGQLRTMTTYSDFQAVR